MKRTEGQFVLNLQVSDRCLSLVRIPVQPPGRGQVREQHLGGVRGRVELLLHLPDRVGVPGLRLRPVPLTLQQRTPPAALQ